MLKQTPPMPRSYERAQPIFDHSTRVFHSILGLLDATVRDDGVDLLLETRDGPDLRGRITFPDPHVLRLQWVFGGTPDAHSSEMLAGPVPSLPVTLTETDDAVTLSAGGADVVLEKRPWKVRFGAFATEPFDASLVEYVHEPGGWVEESSRVLAYETFALRPGEELFGLGERFLGPRLRGKRLAHWIDEPFGTNTTDRVYKSVPFLVSNRGYGVFLHHAEEAVFDVGATSTSSASILVHDNQLDLFVLLGTPKEVLGRYTALTGRAPVPPEWSFGVWMSKCMYESRAEVEEVLATARSLDIPVDVVNLDPLWLEGRKDQRTDFCHFVWDEKAFGPIEDFIGWLHGEDVRLCLWVNPHLMEDGPGWDRSVCVEDGAVRDPYYPDRAWVDLTGPGRDWWDREIRRLVAAGVDAFKLDYGEQLPASSRMADGRTGAQVHNVYPLLASIIAYGAGAPLAYTRAGTAGSQRYPLHWPGDAQSTWAGLAGCLRGGLALAWSGFAHWTTDIGGFFLRILENPEADPDFGFRSPEPELFIRWMQFGMLLSHTRFHGIRGREPWLYGDEAVAGAAAFGALRKRLKPYLLECAREAEASGVPVLRPLALEFPDDPGCEAVDTGYLLGPGLLVYPVLEPGGRVQVYLPPGEWTDHFTGATHSGPGWLPVEQVPLDRLPLLVRAGYSPFTD